MIDSQSNMTVVRPKKATRDGQYDAIQTTNIFGSSGFRARQLECLGCKSESFGYPPSRRGTKCEFVLVPNAKSYWYQIRIRIGTKWELKENLLPTVAVQRTKTTRKWAKTEEESPFQSLSKILGSQQRLQGKKRSDNVGMDLDRHQFHDF